MAERRRNDARADAASTLIARERRPLVSSNLTPPPKAIFQRVKFA
jgi:hypothetical protein